MSARACQKWGIVRIEKEWGREAVGRKQECKKGAFLCAAYPSGPLEDLPVDTPCALLQEVVLVIFGPAGVVDEDGEQHHGRLQEEVERGPELEQENGEARDQHSGDLTRQHVEHVVFELQDEGHRQTQGSWAGGRTNTATTAQGILTGFYSIGGKTWSYICFWYNFIAIV